MDYLPASLKFGQLQIAHRGTLALNMHSLGSSKLILGAIPPQRRRNMSQPGGAENIMGSLGLWISSLISM